MLHTVDTTVVPVPEVIVGDDATSVARVKCCHLNTTGSLMFSHSHQAPAPALSSLSYHSLKSRKKKEKKI